MNKQGKAWGETIKIAGEKHWSVHILKIKKGGFSSKHRHKAKINIFYVISGRLQVTIFRGRTILNPMDDVTILTASERMTIPVDLDHKFEALEDTVCVEIYEGICVDEDIQRIDQGGSGDEAE